MLKQRLLEGNHFLIDYRVNVCRNETTGRCERYITTKKTNAGMKNSHIRGLNKDIQHLM